MRFLIGTERYSWPCASFDVFTEQDNPAAAFISARPFNKAVNSAASLEVAKQWIGDCQRTHKECSPPITGFMHTRVVDLSSNGGFGLVKIVPSHLLSTRSVYATLSYCWGADQLAKTTVSTLKQHQISIRLDTLGQTLQDAIKVARALGVPFLWVDSLCIIQDNPKDVSTEIAKMLEYYENSYVSLCAATVSSSHEGFLEQRNKNPYQNGPFELHYRGPDNCFGSIKLANYLKYCSSEEAVKSRAWILLAPRILSSNYQSIAWSDRESNLNDGGPKQFYDSSERAAWSKIWDWRKFHYGISYAIQKWMVLVQSYTSRLITDPADRLNAISGIARKYGQLLRQCQENDPDHDLLLRQWDVESKGMFGPIEYLSGLWHCKLTPHSRPVIFYHQLLWGTAFYRSSQFHTQLFDIQQGAASIRETQRQSALKSLINAVTSKAAIEDVALPPADTPRRSDNYLEPSWSWASIQGAVYYEDWIKDSTVCDDLELRHTVGVERYETSKSGGIPGGLTVIGRLQRLTYSREKCSWSPYHWKPAFRLDSWEDMVEFSQIVSGEKKGCVLIIVTRHKKFSKPPSLSPWTASTSKGLLLVEDGEMYRHIGLCSMEQVYRGVGSDFSIGSRGMITIV